MVNWKKHFFTYISKDSQYYISVYYNNNALVGIWTHNPDQEQAYTVS